jgi:type I restriction enzyme S subunit
MVEWINCRLSGVCASIDYGLTASASSAPVGPKFLRITDIVAPDLHWGSVPYVSGDIPTPNRYQLHDGDIVIARTGATTGESRFIQNPPDAVFASYLVRLKIKPEFYSRPRQAFDITCCSISDCAM